VKNSYQYVFELREKLEDILKIAHEELQKAQQKGKHHYDRKTKVRKFQPGDKVLVLLPTDHNKLLMQWKGPYEVSAVVGVNDYKVRVKDKLSRANCNWIQMMVIMAFWRLVDMWRSNPLQMLRLALVLTRLNVQNFSIWRTSFQACSPKLPEPQTLCSIT